MKIVTKIGTITVEQYGSPKELAEYKYLCDNSEININPFENGIRKKKATDGWYSTESVIGKEESDDNLIYIRKVGSETYVVETLGVFTDGIDKATEFTLDEAKNMIRADDRFEMIPVRGVR